MEKMAPVSVNFNEKVWSKDNSSFIAFARLWNKYIPRGKGAIPRYIGRLFGGAFQNKYMLTKHGAKLCIEPESLEIFVFMMNNEYTWNEPVFDACASYLKRGAVFLDLGSNIGYFSIEMSKMFDGDLQVYAIEPQTNLANNIYCSKMLNNFEYLEVFDFMIGDIVSEQNLYVGSHTIHASSVPREPNSKVLTKKMETIDSLVEKNVIMPPDVIKIDIEGGELKAFEGMKNTIRKYKPVIVFESDANMRRHGYEREDLFRIVKGASSYKFECINRSVKDNSMISECVSTEDCTDIIAIPVK